MQCLLGESLAIMNEQKVTEMFQRMMGVGFEELQGMVSDTISGILDPNKLMEFIRSMGIDASQLPGMMSQQPGFDAYQVFGLEKSASDEEVKHRYRELISKLHPDASGTPATTFMFRLVLASYEIIRKERGLQ